MHHLYAALRANHLYHRDQHYVVQNGEIVIVGGSENVMTDVYGCVIVDGFVNGCGFELASLLQLPCLHWISFRGEFPSSRWCGPAQS